MELVLFKKNEFVLDKNQSDNGGKIQIIKLLCY